MEKIDVIEEDELDDGYTLCYLIRMVIFAEGMKDGRQNERDKACKRQGNRQAVDAEMRAERQPISRSEDPDTARALRELRRDLKAWARRCRTRCRARLGASLAIQRDRQRTNGGRRFAEIGTLLAATRRSA
ncbi:MAG: hypothetical protein M3Q31_05450 [Actinomycetota bacterium]|nr:hypothetical protein [Actinomycetota bacterium]